MFTFTSCIKREFHIYLYPLLTNFEYWSTSGYNTYKYLKLEVVKRPVRNKKVQTTNSTALKPVTGRKIRDERFAAHPRRGVECYEPPVCGKTRKKACKSCD